MNNYAQKNKNRSYGFRFINNCRVRICGVYIGGVAMSVTEKEHMFDMVGNEYGLNKTVSVVASSIVGALVGFIISANMLPNNPKNVEEKEIN